MTAVAMTLLSLDAVPAEQVHAAFGQAFSDYLIGPFVLTLGQWPQFLARQGVEPGLSRVALNEAGEVLAFAFVAPRPGLLPRWRLATMGAVPAARGSGAARQLLDDFLHRAAQAGLAEVELEVFAQNERARRLYEGRGFTVLHELHGYEAPPLGGERQLLPSAITVADREQAFAWIEQAAVPDLPLQVTPTALRVSPSVLQALQLGSAQLLFAETSPQQLGIASLIDRKPAQADARVLVQALRASHPEHKITVPQLQRLDLGGQALRDGGFAVLPLHQLLMRAIVQN